MNIKGFILAALFAAVLLQTGTVDAIIVKDADSTWNTTSENIPENITASPRIIAEYPNSIFSSDLDTPENITALPRIIVEYSNSIFSSDLEDPPENITASPRIIAEYSNSIWSRNFAFPIGLFNDTEPPVITNVTVINITSYSATITWDTDEIADSLVKYGKQSGIYIESKADSQVVTNHTVVLTVLSQDTTYYFVVNSTDRDMNSNESIEYNFTTREDEIPPYTSGHDPAKGAVNVSIDTNIVIHVLDDDSGVNSSMVVMTVEGDVVTPVITGTSADYTLTYDPPVDFDYEQVVNVAVDASDIAGNPMSQDAYSFTTTTKEAQYFDTGPGTYPSIMGTHEGTITPNKKIVVHKMYTYACAGTGGHTEYVRFHGIGLDVNKTWNGYIGDYHNVTFDPPFTLQANTTYSYEIITGSYPQIIHEQSLPTANGTINCTQFTDANGHTYDNWILAMRLE